MKHPKVYLAGRWNKFDNDWKEEFKKISGFNFYDPEIDSRQGNADNFFPDDLRGIKSSDILIANPGTEPLEATWTEIGYFYALNTRRPGDFCDKLIIIWDKKRKPKWSLAFIKKMGFVVATREEAIKKLIGI